MKTPLKERSYLKRLPRGNYQGNSYVHWSMTMDERKTGWLDEMAHRAFREFLLHAALRYRLVVPVYCLMPDHIHLVSIGLADESDQILAMKLFREAMNHFLEGKGFRLQKQAHDHVFSEEERNRDAFENLVDYIVRNPQRAGLIEESTVLRYPYLGCIVPGYPTVDFSSNDFWDKFWKIFQKLATYTS